MLVVHALLCAHSARLIRAESSKEVSVRTFRSLSELLDPAPGESPDVVLLEPTADEMPRLPGAMRRLMARYPRTRLIVRAVLNQSSMSAIVEAAPGIPFYVSLAGFEPLQGPNGLLDTLATRLVMARDVMQAARPVVSPAGEALLRPVFEVPTSLAVHTIAEEQSRHRNTIRNRFRLAGLPNPKDVLGWSCILHALHFREREGRPYEAIANTHLGCTPGGLRAMIRRKLGASPMEVSARGGFGFARDLFVDYLRTRSR